MNKLKNINLTEIDKLFLNWYFSKYFKKSIWTMGSSLCSDLIYTLGFRIASVYEKSVKCGLPFSQDNENGKSVPDLVIYNVTENPAAGRFGIEHFKVSGCNYPKVQKDGSIKYTSVVCSFEKQLVKSQCNTGFYSSQDDRVWYFYENFEQKYKRHYESVQKYMKKNKRS